MRVMDRDFRFIATRGAIAATVALAGEVLYAIRRPLPDLDGWDASAVIGDDRLPVLRVVALGDSTLTGPGLVDPAEIWARRLVEPWTERHRVEFTSLAATGARTADVLRDQIPRAVEREWDLALVSVGGNDILRAVPIPLFERRLETIVSALQVVTTTVVLMGVGDLGTAPRFPLPLDRMARLSGRIADRVHGRVAGRLGVPKVDHWGYSAEAFRDPAMFAADLFHPSPAGHEVWAETVRPVVEAALGF